MNIQILAPYPLGHAPSQRFRFEQYLNLLQEHDISYTFQSFFDQKAWDVLYKKGYTATKVLSVIKGYLRSFYILFKLRRYDIVFIHREVTPFGPPVCEWVIAKLWKKRIIYDFDDAIWLTDIDRKQWLKIWMKNPSKVNSIIKWSWKISCGNKYLADYSLGFNKNVVVNPTTVDTLHYHKTIKQQSTANVTVGWTGSHSTLPYLEFFFPLLLELFAQFPFQFIIICNKRPSKDLPFMHYIEWNEESEINDLLKLNIGIMPLFDDEWAKGKCGFKAIQYMALGIPALVSPVGVNIEIVDHGLNGYICYSPQDWISNLKTLIENEKLRVSMGASARIKIERNYSLSSNTMLFLSLFETLPL